MTVNGGGEAHGELTLPPPQLTTAGVPLTGIPLLPLTEGYYFTADNVGQAVGCYREFMAWTDRTGWWGDGVGLEIEPDAHIFLQITRGAWGLCRCWHRGWPTGHGPPARMCLKWVGGPQVHRWRQVW